MTRLDRLKADIRAEYEATGTVTAAMWLNIEGAQRHRTELEDYIRSLTGTVDLEARSSFTRLADGGARGRALMNEAVAEMQRERHAALARDIASKRESAQDLQKNVPPAEARARLYGLAALAMSKVRLEITRMDIQKGVYLLKAAFGYALPVAFEANRWGPHSAELTSDGERIGTQRQWFGVGVKPPKILPKSRISEVPDAAAEILGDTDVAERLLRQLAAYSTRELETLSTVHWCIEKHIPAHEQVSIDNVRRALRREQKFKGKENQPNFSAEEIRKSLERLVALGIIEPTRLAV
jgi:hypothetical protein